MFWLRVFNFAQTMSGDELLSDTNNDDRHAEPSLTQMLQGLLTDRQEKRGWEREHIMSESWPSARRSKKYS